jgi:hypothetical protein
MQVIKMAEMTPGEKRFKALLDKISQQQSHYDNLVSWHNELLSIRPMLDFDKQEAFSADNMELYCQLDDEYWSCRRSLERVRVRLYQPCTITQQDKMDIERIRSDIDQAIQRQELYKNILLGFRWILRVIGFPLSSLL